MLLHLSPHQSREAEVGETGVSRRPKENAESPPRYAGPAQQPPTFTCALGGRGRGGRRLLNSAIAVILACVPIVALLLSFPGPALAEPPSATPTTVITLGKQAEQQMESLQAEAAGVRAEIEALDVQIEQLTEQYNAISVRLGETNARLLELRRKQEITQASYRAKVEAMNQRAVSIYKSGGDQPIEILLSTRDFSDFVGRLLLLTKIALRDQMLAEGLRTTADELSVLETAIEEQKAQQVELRGELESRQEEIEAALVAREESLAQVNTAIAEVIEQEKARQEEERLKLEAEIRARYPDLAASAVVVPQTPEQVLSQVVETAAVYLGLPYLWAGEKPSTGMDCSGLVMYVFRQHGVDLPHFAAYQIALGAPVDISDIQPGDLVGFGSPVHHIGIYIGDGLFIHAPHTGDVVRVSRLADRSDLTAIVRFPLQARTGPPTFD